MNPKLEDVSIEIGQLRAIVDELAGLDPLMGIVARQVMQIVDAEYAEVLDIPEHFQGDTPWWLEWRARPIS